MRLDRLVLDPWTPLAYKQQLAGPTDGAGPRGVGKSWMPAADRRRITAYLVLRAYQANTARALLIDNKESEDRREYGDADLIVQTVLGALLGHDQQVRVPDAAAIDRQLTPSDAEYGTPEQVRARAAADREDWLARWGDREKLQLKVLDAEAKAVGLGDAVYLVAWSAAKGRPRLRVFDPGFYFPVLETADEDDYPTRVHLAWEEPDAQGNPVRLRRITYELAPIRPASEVAVSPLGLLRRILRIGPNEQPVLTPGDVWLPDNSIGRRYPWQAPDEPPSTTTCYLTDVSWPLDRIDQRSTLDDMLDDRTAEYAVGEDGELLDRLDLRIDFLPVVHLPNTWSGAEHYGTSVLANVLQVLDDLGSADTDSQAASATTGNPPIGLSGTEVPDDPVLRPGEVWGLGQSGALHTLDTSRQLAELRSYCKDLQERLSQNARTPGVVLGRVKPSDVPSGFALSLGFAPFDGLVRQMRLVRADKYRLLLSMVQRLAMAGHNPQTGVGLPPGEVFDGQLQLGTYLPADRQSAVDTVRKLLGNGTEPPAISLDTAVRMLTDVGLPVADVEDEVHAVLREWLAGAVHLADATGDAAAVRERLGLPAQPLIPPLPTPPAPLPPAGP